MHRWPVALLLLASACTATPQVSAHPSSSSETLLGPSPSISSSEVLVQSILGTTEASARASLLASGFRVLVQHKFSQLMPPGTVLSQDPQPGQYVAPGTTVIITVAKAVAPKGSMACPGTSLRGVYHSYRLHVLGTCRWVVGIVYNVIHEQDGDYHVDVTPDSRYRGLLDAGNSSQQHGALVTEIMPGQKLSAPFIGERVAVFGTWVLDADHGWNEIHPIWAIRYLDTGRMVSALPPSTPRYEPEAGGGGTSGGGGSCSASTGYYASSYSTAYLIYPASNPDWRDLSPTYLRHFCTLAEAQRAFPGRSVDTDG